MGSTPPLPLRRRLVRDRDAIRG
ncbi:transcriptional regulator, partial [Mesorhizobium sp. USDA-HM6]